MIRTQVYITEQEKKMLTQLSKQTGESKSTLIRQAINLLCSSIKSKSSDRAKRINAAAGIWEDRTDLDEFFKKLRKEGDRKF